VVERLTLPSTRLPRPSFEDGSRNLPSPHARQHSRPEGGISAIGMFLLIPPPGCTADRV